MHVCDYTADESGAQGRKKASDTGKLELQVVVNHLTYGWEPNLGFYSFIFIFQEKKKKSALNW